MDRWRGKIALVTGASTGIGAATACALAKHGMIVIGCSRHPSLIEEAAASLEEDCPGKLEALCCDVSKEEDIQSMFEHIITKYGGVDVCVNNAGVAVNAPLLSGKTQDWKNMLDVNVLGLCICAREAIASMKKRDVAGHIINICSVSGHRCTGSKSSNFYSATKFAVRAITEGLRSELRQENSQIRVSEISPGVVQTEFFPKLIGRKSSKRMYKSMECLQSDDIAEGIVYMLSAPPHVQVADILLRCTEQAT